MANKGLSLVSRTLFAIYMGFSSPPDTIVSCRFAQTHESRNEGRASGVIPLNNPSPHWVVNMSLLLLPVLRSFMLYLFYLDLHDCSCL